MRSRSFTRRRLLAAGLATVVPVALLPARRASAHVPERRLRLFHTHTGERADVVFRRGDTYVPEALAELDHHLRDHRKGIVHPYDPRVFDLLCDLLEAVDRSDAELSVICGFRTTETNEMLRHRTSGVAERSLHLQAQAIDVRVSGTKTERLRDAALSLGRGGVGYYRASDFIHVDTGRVRRW